MWYLLYFLNWFFIVCIENTSVMLYIIVPKNL